MLIESADETAQTVWIHAGKGLRLKSTAAGTDAAQVLKTGAAACAETSAADGPAKTVRAAS
ncbi:MAG TPA: hypothetical protein VGJ04_10900 [Pirellulales bacterium]